MSLAEVLPALKKLNRANKIRAIQFLIDEIAEEEGILDEKNQEHAFFSLRNSFEAAHKLQKLLDERKATV